MSGQCFIETTILVEALFKSSERRKRARDRVGSYDRSVLPIYAIKELKGGALRHFIWAHNKLSETGSFTRTLSAIQRAFMKPYLQNTALEAIQVGAELLIGSKLSNAQTRVDTDIAIADSFRLSLRRRIDRGWKDRRKLATETADELSCFSETAPRFNESTKLLEDDRRGCDLEPKCCLAQKLREKPEQLAALLTAIKPLARPEDNKRRQALHLLKNTPKWDFDDASCRALGDAYFALRCPTGCSILTSNLKDHTLLASALGKNVEAYKP